MPRIAVFIDNEIKRYKRDFSKEIYFEVSALEIYCENIRDLLWSRDPRVDPSLEAFVEMKAAGQKVAVLG